jgi:hypothetical protein
MANLPDHIAQAKHNLECAEKFLQGGGCDDWAITAAFYAAVHFAEAGFAATEIEHTESSCPDEEEPHAYRERTVKEKFGVPCWKSYRKLREASFNVRYLVLWKSGRIGTALDYYSSDDVNRFVKRDLPTIRGEIQKSGVDLN